MCLILLSRDSPQFFLLHIDLQNKKKKKKKVKKMNLSSLSLSHLFEKLSFVKDEDAFRAFRFTTLKKKKSVQKEIKKDGERR